MTGNDNLDPRTLSFSQANGYEELPQPLALGEISDDARRKLWDLLWTWAWPRGKLSIVDRVSAPWDSVLLAAHQDFFKRPADEFKTDAIPLLNLYKSAILLSLPLEGLFDLWQLIMRHPSCPSPFIVDTSKIFEECQLAYIVDTNGISTILPAATTQEGEALIGALGNLNEGGYSGAEVHLREAGIQISAGDWAESVRESIHAVESVARVLDPRDASTLDRALKSLEKQIRIHPALKDAFSKLYGYTSDEEGIRHALLQDDSSPVGRDEAVFMLGACASFVTYLLSKQRTGTTND